jgi:hypothetical protein
MTASNIVKGKGTNEEKLKAIFYFVRDQIKFGFHKKGDLIAASEIIRTKLGQCNNKSALFHALCKVSGLESRIHFSGIRKEIQRGLFTGIAYKLMPPEISHSWVEVKLNNRWIKIDSFINDLKFYEAGKKKLKQEGLKTGYSVSCDNSDSSADFNISNERFVQMDAVTDDHGTYEEPMEYFKSSSYKNRPTWLKLLLYKMLVKRINKRISTLRFSSDNSLSR